MSSHGGADELRRMHPVVEIQDGSPAIMAAREQASTPSPYQGEALHSEWELLSPSALSQCGSSPRSVSEKELFSESDGHQMGSRGDLSVSGSDKDGGHIGVQVTEREAASEIEVEITTSEDGSQATLHLRLPLDCAPEAVEAEPADQLLLGDNQEEQAEAAEEDEGSLRSSLLTSEGSYAHISKPSSPAAGPTPLFPGADTAGGSPQVLPISDLDASSDEDDASDTESPFPEDFLPPPDIGVCSVVTGFPMAGGALDAVAAAEAQEALGIDLAGLGVFSALSRSSSTSAADLLSQDACSDNSAAEDLEALAASAASGKGSGSSKKERLRQAMHRVCQWLKVLAERVRAALPSNEQLQALLHRLQLVCPGVRWSAALPWASAVLLGSLLAYSMRKNVQLASALRRKDQDLQFMVLKVLTFNDAIKNGCPMPILRHTSSGGGKPSLQPYHFV